MKSKKPTKNINIEKGLKIPPKGTKKRKYHLDELEVNDSILFFDKTVNQVNSAIQGEKKRSPKRVFTLRKEDNGVRVYRIK